MKNYAALFLILCIVPGTAFSEGRDDRDRREGVRAGSFVFKPEVKVSESFESNYLLLDTNEVDTFITEIAPALVIESDFNRHALRLTSFGAFGFYSADGDDNYTDYGTRLDGVIDVTRDHRLIMRAGYARLHEDRGEDDVPGNALEPVKYQDWETNLSADLNFGRFRFEPFVFAEYLDFESVPLVGGGFSNQNDRDRYEYGGGVEVGYAVLSGYEAFIRGGYKGIHYKEIPDDNGFDRDSDGFQVLGGLKVDLTRLIEASIGLGWENRNYDDPAFEDFSGFSANARARWDITQRTSLFATVERVVEETTVNNASGKVDFGGSIGVEHELLRTLGVFAGLGYYDRDFEGIPRNDDIFFARAGAEWDVWRYAALGLDYEFEHRDSNQAGLDYGNHTVSLSVRFFY
ncbi:outer membrane beta-barrel protein [Limibaculum sp. M0105]|uniref:Outer membrane beta-barrel protein n=1 Tax=Thermohalobaculum xanthum TaxID=2753746 RepID=A0A8J7M6F6_9RHOB|nr:outer membrane beta-barrel protein [Thermohalobaculum xanthum]MBK0398722.1 outer membrane beta-barrel protein [Thermohalobaculum xanthum]